jgi:hypothetical protein
MRSLILISLIVTSFTTFGQSTLEEEIQNVCQSFSSKLQGSAIKKIAVSEFLDISCGSLKIGKYISDEVGVAMAMASGSYEVVERARLSVLLKEQRFSNDVLMNDSTRIRLGNIYGVQALLLGTITLFDNDMRLTMRMINTETGALVHAQAVNINYNDRIRSLLSKANTKAAEPAKELVVQTNRPSIADTRPKCEKDQLGDLKIKNTYYHRIEVTPLGSNGLPIDASPLSIPQYDSRVYYELKAGVNKFEVVYYKQGMTSDLVNRTEVIQVKIDACKTVEFEIK